VPEISIAFDGDGDGGAELAADGGYVLQIYDGASAALEWTSTPVFAPMDLIGVGDTDGNGRRELINVSDQADPGDGVSAVASYDATSLALNWQINLFSSLAAPHLTDIAIADVDEDGTAEIVGVGIDEFPEARLVVIDGQNRSVRHEHELGPYVTPLAVAAADVDADGNAEALVAGVQNGQARVYAIDPASGVLEWQAKLASYFDYPSMDIGVANLDADPALEVVTSNHRVFVVDGATRQVTASERNDIASFTLVPARRGRFRIIAGTSAGEALGMRARGQIAENFGSLCDERIAALHRLRRRSVVFACGSRLGVLDLESSAVAWRSEDSASIAVTGSNLRTWRSHGSRRIAAGTRNSVLVLEERQAP